MGPDKQQTDGAAFEKEIADLFAVEGPEEGTANDESDAAEDQKEDESEQ